MNDEINNGEVGGLENSDPTLFDLDPYCLCRNPQTAGREGTTRERLLERTRTELDKIAGAGRRASAKTLGVRVGRVLERSKVGKFVRRDELMGGSHGALTKTRSLPKNSSTAVTLSVLRCPTRRWPPPR